MSGGYLDPFTTDMEARVSERVTNADRRHGISVHELDHRAGSGSGNRRTAMRISLHPTGRSPMPSRN
jgi:hypothetical protein